MRLGRWTLRAAAIATGCLAALVAGEASAQQTQTTQIDLPKFNPAPPGDRFFGVPSPYAADNGMVALHGALTLDYARDPLKLVRTTNDETEDLGAVVSDQLFLHAAVNFSIISRIAISASMPFALVSKGDAPEGGSLRFDEPSGAAVGDLRLGARFRLFGEYHDPFQIGVGGYFWLPTGFDSSYVSDGNFRGQPQLLMGGRADRFIWTVMAGPTFRTGSTTVGNVELGHEMDWGAGVGVLLLDKRTLQLHVESYGAIDLESPPDTRTPNAEILGGVKWRLPGIEFIELGLGAGPGVTKGVGTPVFRGLFQIAYTPVINEPQVDTDKDGIFDPVDACPRVPGVKSEDPAKNGCPPESDRDHDGILDNVDACPDEPGKPNADPKKNGCPDRDTDKDGIFDDVDACPTEPGVPRAKTRRSTAAPSTTRTTTASPTRRTRASTSRASRPTIRRPTAARPTATATGSATTRTRARTRRASTTPIPRSAAARSSSSSPTAR